MAAPGAYFLYTMYYSIIHCQATRRVASRRVMDVDYVFVSSSFHFFMGAADAKSKEH